MPLGSRKPAYPFVLNEDCSLAQGLIGWFPGEPAGSRLFDFSRRANHASINGTTRWGAAKDGGHALSYDGSSGFARTGAYSSPTSCTLTAWVMPTSSLSGTDSTVCGFADMGVTQFSTYLCASGGNWAFAAYDGSTETAPSGGARIPAAQGRWDFIAGVQRNGVSLAGYFNGNNLGTVSFGTAFTGWDTGPFFHIARSFSQTYFPGFIGDVTLHNRPLSDAEVYSLWDPASRWQLRYRPGRKAWFFAPPPSISVLVPVIRRLFTPVKMPLPRQRQILPLPGPPVILRTTRMLVRPGLSASQRKQIVPIVQTITRMLVINRQRVILARTLGSPRRTPFPVVQQILMPVPVVRRVQSIVAKMLPARRQLLPLPVATVTVPQFLSKIVVRSYPVPFPVVRRRVIPATLVTQIVVIKRSTIVR